MSADPFNTSRAHKHARAAGPSKMCNNQAPQPIPNGNRQEDSRSMPPFHAPELPSEIRHLILNYVLTPLPPFYKASGSLPPSVRLHYEKELRDTYMFAQTLMLSEVAALRNHTYEIIGKNIVPLLEADMKAIDRFISRESKPSGLFHNLKSQSAVYVNYYEGYKALLQGRKASLEHDLGLYDGLLEEFNMRYVLGADDPNDSDDEHKARSSIRKSNPWTRLGGAFRMARPP